MKIDGIKIRDSLKNELREKVNLLPKKPKLAVILANETRASLKYVEIKKKFGEGIGVEVIVLKLQKALEERLIKEIKKLNKDESISGIIVQLPLAGNIDTEKVVNVIDPNKDVDSLGESGKFTPPLVKVIEKIFQETNFDYRNKNILIVGQGKLVGGPIARFFEKEGLKPAVVDEYNKGDLEEEAKKADIIITGVGIPSLIKKEMIKDKVFLIDAGTSFKDGKLEGDIDKNCFGKASFYTPVPGGVGPITVSALFENLLKSVKKA